ncbi:MAG: hypothetical protein ABSC64_02115 [Candidatus Korobacteraceae bacterium]
MTLSDEDREIVKREGWPYLAGWKSGIISRLEYEKEILEKKVKYLTDENKKLEFENDELRDKLGDEEWNTMS